MTPEEIRASRIKLMLTEAEFARALNCTAAAVNLWEHGLRKPSGSVIKLIKILVKYPSLVGEDL